MLAKYPGLLIERSPNGSIRYRVRPERQKNVRIAISVPPGDPDFDRQYWDARAGVSSRHDAIARIAGTGKLHSESLNMLRKAKQRAKDRGHECTITADLVLQLLAEQGGKCALTGLDLDLRPSPDNGRRPFAPSIDRIDNSRGYVDGNVRITSVIANVAAADWSAEDFQKMCEAVALRVGHLQRKPLKPIRAKKKRGPL